ncbi:MAG: hypothetical protein WC366_02585 [Bacilli bacterium]|jgi:hypothetical protein
MKNQKSILTITALALLCIPIGKILIDTGHISLIDGANADITKYTVRLDSTNTPSFLGESSLGSNEMATPSRSVPWVYYSGSRTYPGAHMAVGDLLTGSQQFTSSSVNFTGAISVTIDWTLLNDLNPHDVSVMLYRPGVYPMNILYFDGLTSPHTFTRTDMGAAYKSLHIGLQFFTNESAPDAIFVLNSLEVVYDCIPVS